jgi:hypothetical protein
MKKIFLILSTLALVACKLDDNIDPNLPQTKDLSPRNLITAAKLQVMLHRQVNVSIIKYLD